MLEYQYKSNFSSSTTCNIFHLRDEVLECREFSVLSVSIFNTNIVLFSNAILLMIIFDLFHSLEVKNLATVMPLLTVIWFLLEQGSKLWPRSNMGGATEVSLSLVISIVVHVSCIGIPITFKK